MPKRWLVPPIVATLAAAALLPAIAAPPTTLPSDDRVTLYGDDPADPWNRAHAALLGRTLPDGRTLGLDAVDPLLWRNTRFLRDGPSAAAAIAALHACVAMPATRPAIERAIFQRDLWAVFDWSTELPTREESQPRALQAALARAMRHVALDAAEVAALPDTYARAVASHRWPTAFDPARPDAAFLPDLDAPDGPWIEVGPAEGTPLAASAHAAAFGDRSTFSVYFAHPDGRAAGLAYLKTLPTSPGATTQPGLPQPPVGTAVALVRWMNLFDRDGRLAPTRVAEQVQLRVFRTIPADRDAPTPADQAVFEFELDRRALFADDAGLRSIGPDDARVLHTQFFSMGFDAFESAAATRPGVTFATPVLGECITCHGRPGIASVNTYTRAFGPSVSSVSLGPSSPGWEAARTLDEKRRTYAWGLLDGLRGE